MYYRKKPVVIQAVQWTGNNFDEVMDFLQRKNVSYDSKTGLIIHTLEGDHFANMGDFIIRGVKGEYYPCKPDIFAATYDKE